MNKEDSDIRELIAMDEEKGFRLMFERYYASLCAVAQLYIPNKAEAEDVVQQLLIKLWEEKHFKSINSSYRSYLQTGIKNACLNALNKNKTREKMLQSLPGEEIVDQAFDFLTNEEEQAIFEKAFSDLPDQGRKVIELVYFSDNSYKGAADTLNVSVNTIKSHLKNTLQKLRNNKTLNYYYKEKK